MKKNMPKFLEELLTKDYLPEEIEEIYNGYTSKRNTTFRVNTIKSDINSIKEQLKPEGINYKNAQWYEDAFILGEQQEIILQQLDIYKKGEIYLQSLSSMLPPIILNTMPKENVLDMCAAPGGKTTQMAALSENKAYITACERSPIRAGRLKYNIETQGCKGITVIVKDARDLDDFLKFDKILLDAPCSGSGTINLDDKKLESSFTQDLINKSVKTQKALIKKAIGMLKIGGELVYSTCSILKEENEKIIQTVLDNKNIQIVPIDINKSIPTLSILIEGTVCIKPCKRYEGFFVAKLKKIG